MTNYFVMLNHPNPNINAVVMVNEDDEVSFFSSAEWARTAALDNPLGENFGYEIFELGTGDL
jgi:hypothetical protein